MWRPQSGHEFLETFSMEALAIGQSLFRFPELR
jgi:hypothetical protein